LKEFCKRFVSIQKNKKKQKKERKEKGNQKRAGGDHS
jgi:hypothetical protein